MSGGLVKAAEAYLRALNAQANGGRKSKAKPKAAAPRRAARPRQASQTVVVETARSDAGGAVMRSSINALREQIRTMTERLGRAPAAAKRTGKKKKKAPKKAKATKASKAPKAGGKKGGAKRPRTAAQKAATARMLAALKAKQGKK